ncbi:MAG: ribonuclease J [Trueperaceae bacterium]|nr:ribonuclease J [Trueperaceae bacterium]
MNQMPDDERKPNNRRRPRRAGPKDKGAGASSGDKPSSSAAPTQPETNTAAAPRIRRGPDEAGRGGKSSTADGGGRSRRPRGHKSTTSEGRPDHDGGAHHGSTADGKLKVIALGGMGEIGKNMFAFEYDDEILLIDGGLAFPETEMLGVDIIVPKIDWVVENAHKIKGWVLTHGHEDHIGGLPYMLRLLPKIPMYGARLTLGLLRGKFDEFKLREADVDLREISTDDRVKISKNFTVDFFRMTHSIPDNSGVIIHTPIGRVVHSGDFKLDYNPSDGKTSHLHKLAQAGADGVLLLISDSTNAERPGYTPSEHDVAMAVDEIVAKAKGRVVVTTFSSHVHRLQNFVRIAERYDRRVVAEGRSMVKAIGIAQELGYLEAKNPLLSTDDINDLQDDKVLFLCTGSQGQPMAALSRLANGTHRKIRLKPGDTVILSSNPIPGNEEAVGRVINQLYASRVNVLYPPAYKVHASGHASREELKLILDLTRPKFFLPWHGEMRHQVHHQRLADGMSDPPTKSLIVANGDVVELSRDDMKVTGSVDAGVVLIDTVGKAGDEVTEPIIRDRQTLSAEGVVVIMALASKTPTVEVIMRGVASGNNGLKDEVVKIALESLQKGVREKRRLGDIRDDIFYPVRRYIRKATGRNPLIVPTVIEN